MKKALLFSVVTLLSISSAMAEEKSAFDLRSEEIIVTLSADQKAQLGRILSAHGLISSTRYTMDHVKNAVTSCSKEHSNMAKLIKTHWKSFNGKIHPILKKADGAFARTIAIEDVLPKKEMKTYLALLDEEAKENIVPVPITREDDCTRLIAQLSNEETKNELTTILNESFGF